MIGHTTVDRAFRTYQKSHQAESKPDFFCDRRPERDCQSSENAPVSIGRNFRWEIRRAELTYQEEEPAQGKSKDTGQACVISCFSKTAWLP